jgi:hypothetical protein
MKTRTKPTLPTPGPEPVQNALETLKQREKRQTAYDRVICQPKGFANFSNF